MPTRKTMTKSITQESLMLGARTSTNTPEAMNATLKIAQYNYDCDRDHIIFSLKDINGNTFEQTAAEIALNSGMISALSPHDALTIGYVAGMEHADLNHFHH